MVTVVTLVMIVGVLALLFRMKPNRLTLRILKLIELSAEADPARDADKPTSCEELGALPLAFHVGSAAERRA
jgi:hypothetical protein